MTQEEYKIGKKVGEGSYGRVHLALMNDNTIKAVKIMKIGSDGVESALEMSIMMSYTHPYINTAHSIDVDSHNIHILMDLSKYDLGHHLDLKLPIPREWYGQLAQVLYYLHSENIIHCDIKPGNILVSQNDTLLLTDFSHSVLAESRYTTFNHIIGSLDYCSPEVLAKKPWTMATDVWSLGCVYYEMSTKKRVGKEKNSYNYLVAGKYRTVEFECEQDRLLILENMLVINPNNRIRCDQLIEHPFLCGAEEVDCYYFQHDDVELSDRNERLFSKVCSGKIIDKRVREVALKMFRFTEDVEVSLVKIEACLSLSHKIIKGYRISPSILSSHKRDINEKEMEICKSLRFRIH